MSTSESIPPSPPSLAVRILRGLALFGLTLGLGLVGGLFLFTLFPPFHELFGKLMNANARLPSLEAGIPFAFALLVLTPLGVGYAARRLQPRSLRGWVFLGLIAAAALVANLILVALFPSVREGIETLLGVAFWKVRGLVVVLVGFTLLALGAVAWLLRPSSLRGFVQFGLAIGSILTLDLVLVAFCPPLLGEFQGFPQPFFNVHNNNGETFGLLVLALFLIALTPLVVLVVAWRLRLHSWRWIGGGYLVLLPVLAYLAADDPVIRRPMTMEEIAPVFPGAEKSFEVLMRYGSQHPLGRDFRAPSKIWKKPIVAGENMDTSKPAEWQAWLTGHRSDIESDWADLAPVRAWWTELNTFDRIGDLTPPSIDAEMITFSPLRTMTQHGCAVASLQALDGRGDEAIDTLLPILQVGRKLQSSSRTLVRTMVAIIVERMSVQTAAFIVDHATLSPAARARLTAALAAPGGGPAGARRLMAMQYAFGLNLALAKPLGDLVSHEGSPWLRHVLNAISPFTFNARSSFNLYGDFVAEEEELVANRQFDRLGSRTKTFFTQEARPRFKNFAGTLLIGAAIPAMSKVAESYWKTQDLRTELLARLTKS